MVEVIELAKTDTLNIRIEPELKKEVEITLNELGMNIADAVTIFLKQVVLTESIPFVIKNPQYSDEMKVAILETEEMKENPEKYKSFDNVDELMEDLNNNEQI